MVGLDRSRSWRFQARVALSRDGCDVPVRLGTEGDFPFKSQARLARPLRIDQVAADPLLRTLKALLASPVWIEA